MTSSPVCLPMRRLETYDTTLRDGAQSEGISFSVQDKLLLTERLDSLGFDFVEGGYPGSNEKDFEYFQRVAQLELKHIKVCAFGMTRRRGTRAEDDAGLGALLASGAKVITIVGKSSAFQATEILRTSLEENLAMIGDSIRLLKHAGREVIFDAEHFFDGYKADPDYSLQAVRAAADAGASTVVLCDTNGGSMPEEIAAITRAVVAALPVKVGIHCHNDCELAVANSLAAVDAGATQVQGTINGFGERCGNTDLISIIANLAIKKHGYDLLLPGGVRHLTELSRYVYEMVNMNFPAHQPFVGKSAFAHKGGMHVSAIARNTASYEHIAPEVVGNERRILVSELSGRSNIVAMTTKYKIEHDKTLMDKILAKVVSKEHAGYQFEAAEGSFDLLVRQCAGVFEPHFELLNYHVNVENAGDGQTTTEATIKLRIGDEVRHEVAEGDGPINALDAAIRKALNGTFPNLAEMHLVDYKVRVVNSEAATAAGVRVVIENRDERDVWGTVGVSENVIEASWIALVDSYEYKLCKDEKREINGFCAARGA
ncbi:MAG: citramalate synthase [Thermoguttaceae bacterium]|nr:citramalate synthase [Thermoguttaceae bacterium]